jgi:dihydroorotate dehydrogenase (fumarate)
LHGKIKASLAATTGIYTGEDAVKMIMAGADAVMVCSALLKEGINRLSEILRDMEHWMEKRGYGSVKEMKGVLSHASFANAAAFERANYTRALSEYKVKSADKW